MPQDPVRRQELADEALVPILRLALAHYDGRLVDAGGEILLDEELLGALEKVAAEFARTSNCYDDASVEESFELLVARAEPRSILNDAWALVRSHGIPALQAEAEYRVVDDPSGGL